ncbi:MAG TPA: 3-deoxy-D-manno-octulosonic acid transferase [Acidobacteriaceae bacterium]|nr:3-deoxy-D-manno-octulosonic acid transferase [Acidobacteriaceae bacterium]
MLEFVTMALYSLLLACVLALGAPYWLWRAARGGPGWASGLLARLGRVPGELREAVEGRKVVWVHAVSVGEVLAATRLVAELEHALGDEWSIVVSTTTATGQALAIKRFAGVDREGSARVFYYPLDFAMAVRAYLRALRPRMLILMESELWPRMLAQGRWAGIPVVVANARVSDRSFARGMRVRPVWSRLLRQVTLFLAQSEEDARRLIAMGAAAEAVRAVGNLKYDAAEPRQSEIARWLGGMHRAIIVAGSTLEGEEEMALIAWEAALSSKLDPLLVLAPRHPERFRAVEALLAGGKWAKYSGYLRASDFGPERKGSGHFDFVLLDTIGDLAAVYGVADVAFVGGSLVPRGGHNPLEPARFGVPVVMGRSYENFRDIVGKMQEAGGIRIVRNGTELKTAFQELLTNSEAAKALGERGRKVFEEQQGATVRATEALRKIIGQDRDCSEKMQSYEVRS